MSSNDEILARLEHQHAQTMELISKLAHGLSAMVDEVGRLIDETQRALDQLVASGRTGIRRIPTRSSDDERSHSRGSA